MKESDAKDAMKKVAEEYERKRLRRAQDEASAAFDESWKALRDNIGDSPERFAALRAAADDSWSKLLRARQELDSHILAFPEING